jgi:oxygen-independent coproporphyrinogen-3 oxidase
MESRNSSAGAQEKYFAALVRELELHRMLGRAGKLSTAFIGGGTPTKPRPDLLIGLIRYLREKWGFAEGYEVTAEANPETLPEFPLEKLADAGVTRLSVGVQSTHSHHLKWLGRGVDWPQVKRGLDAVRRKWRGRLSFDILYGLPGQTCDEILCDIERLMVYSPEHLSAYQLTPEKGTPLGSRAAAGKTALPSDGDALLQQRFIERRLAARGLMRYEISNYALPGAECRHNVAVWSGEDYIGAGVSAMGYVGGVRYLNAKTLEAYFNRVNRNMLPASRMEVLNSSRSRHERIAFGLRMSRGLNVSADFELPIAVLDLLERGFLVKENGNIRIADGKLHFHDIAAASFVD